MNNSFLLPGKPCLISHNCRQLRLFAKATPLAFPKRRRKREREREKEKKKKKKKNSGNRRHASLHRKFNGGRRFVNQS